MQVPSTTMRVAHTFEVVRQAKVVSVFSQGYINPVCRCLINGRSNPELRPYLHLWGGVGVLLLFLISPAALCLCRGSGAFLRMECFQCLAAGRYRWRLGAVWEYKPLGGRPVQDKSSLSREPSAVS